MPTVERRIRSTFALANLTEEHLHFLAVITQNAIVADELDGERAIREEIFTACQEAIKNVKET